jgi:fucose 4-O-acetylase-like acetyltransferase
MIKKLIKPFLAIGAISYIVYFLVSNFNIDLEDMFDIGDEWGES